MKKALTIGLAAAVLLAASSMAVADGVAAVQVSVPYYVREPRIIHVLRPEDYDRRAPRVSLPRADDDEVAAPPALRRTVKTGQQRAAVAAPPIPRRKPYSAPPPPSGPRRAVLSAPPPRAEGLTNLQLTPRFGEPTAPEKIEIPSEPDVASSDPHRDLIALPPPLSEPPPAE